jgi:hypothetical protein
MCYFLMVYNQYVDVVPEMDIMVYYYMDPAITYRKKEL